MLIEIIQADSELRKWSDELRLIAGGKARPAMARALNRAGDSSHGKVRTLLSREMGVKRLNLGKAMKKAPARGDALEFATVGTGKHFSLIDAKGVKRSWVGGTLNGHPVRLQRVAAAAWNVPRLYKGAFISRGSAGQVVGAGARQIFARASSGRFPLKKLWGPSVPRELVRERSVAVFDATVREVFPRRMAHEFKRILP